MSIIRKIIPCRFKKNGYECETAKGNPKSCGKCLAYSAKLPLPSLMLTSSDYSMFVAQMCEGE